VRVVFIYDARSGCATASSTNNKLLLLLYQSQMRARRMEKTKSKETSGKINKECAEKKTRFGLH
jgi:hypothetical protein